MQTEGERDWGEEGKREGGGVSYSIIMDVRTNVQGNACMKE